MRICHSEKSHFFFPVGWTHKWNTSMLILYLFSQMSDAEESLLSTKCLCEALVANIYIYICLKSQYKAQPTFNYNHKCLCTHNVSSSRILIKVQEIKNIKCLPGLREKNKESTFRRSAHPFNKCRGANLLSRILYHTSIF